MSLKQETIHRIIAEKEKGYVNDKDDSGGETKYGVTVDVARAYGYYGDMQDLPLEVAYSIYEDRYWAPLKLSNIELMSIDIAKEMIDTAINQGVHRAAVYLQRSLNVLNNNQKYYNDVLVDGRIGPITLSALKSYFNVRGKEGHKVLFNMLNCLQGSFYVELAESRKKDEKFIYGWFSHRVNIT